MYRSPKLTFSGTSVRINRALVSGTSVTAAVNRLQCFDPAPAYRQIFDRTAAVINATSAGSTNANPSAGSLPFEISGCKTLNLFMTAGAITTTGGIYGLRVSPDGTNWAVLPGSVQAVASSTVLLTCTNVSARFAQIIVLAAASGQTGTFACLTAQA